MKSDDRRMVKLTSEITARIQKLAGKYPILSFNKIANCALTLTLRHIENNQEMLFKPMRK